MLRGARIVRENGVEVVVPPRHHQIVTAMLRVGPGRQELQEARRELERALAGIDRKFAVDARRPRHDGRVGPFLLPRLSSATA